MFENEILAHYHSDIRMTSRSWWVRHVIFVIGLLYRTFKEKLKIQGNHPFKVGFGFTMTCIMIVYKNVMKSGTN